MNIEKPKITAIVSQLLGECLAIDFKDIHILIPRKEIEKELDKYYYPKKKYGNKK